MNPLFDGLVRFYNNLGWPVKEVPDNTILSVLYSGEKAEWDFIASSDESNQIITFFSRVPETCPPDKFSTMSEFLERANFGMTHGAWVMDRNDGEIRYRVGVDVGKLEINYEFLNDLTLYTNLTMDYYLEGILGVIHNNLSAEEAFAIVFPEA